MSGWTIREAVPADARELAALAERTFRDAYPGVDVEAYCARSFGPEVQRLELEDPGVETRVAEADGRLVAYSQVVSGPPPECVGDPSAPELRRIYVTGDWHGTGLAGELLARTVDGLADRGARTLWLGVWERNPRAIRFYEKQGFRRVGSQEFDLGRERHRDAIMVRALRVGR